MNTEPNDSDTPARQSEIRERTRALIDLVGNDGTVVALDSLLAAYVHVATQRGRIEECGGVLQRLGAQMGGAMRVATAIVPSAATIDVEDALKQPPKGYTEEDVRIASGLVEQFVAATWSVNHRCALSALLTVYMQVAERQGESVKAAEHLVSVGGGVLLQAMLDQAGGPKAQTTAEVRPQGTTVH